ncbi:MAG: small multi-drug export protein [Patescibacteria group bacterium]|nr:small multi-drug export protein [Patescibacteria group bacterium]
MIEWFLNLNIPPELITFFIAMTPIAELRGAIPIALGVFNLSVPSAFFWAWLGNIIPGIFWVFALNFVSRTLSAHSKAFKKFFEWLFRRTHEKFWGQHEKLGSLALVVFVAIPLPVTGVWTGAVAAFIFGIPKTRAILLLSLGALGAAIIVTLIYLGVFSFLRFLL